MFLMGTFGTTEVVPFYFDRLCGTTEAVGLPIPSAKPLVLLLT